MKIFIDSASIIHIENVIKKTGLVDGITTNPLLISHQIKHSTKHYNCFKKATIDVIKDISSIFDGPISAEIIEDRRDNMLLESEQLYNINNNINIKIPFTVDGLFVCKYLREIGVNVNVTLCFTASQALIAAKSNATYISLFLGRTEDQSYSGETFINDVKKIYTNYDFKTQILVASVRSINHVIMAAKCGADVITMSPDILYKLYNHCLTDHGIEEFNNCCNLSVNDDTINNGIVSEPCE